MKIDYVVPMVFESDVKWRNDYFASQKTRLSNIGRNVRFRSWGTEQLLIKCIKKFMPWVGDIHILLARESQVQPWMKEEGVNVVFHKQFIPEKYLPTFNSCTIEMFLPYISDVSEAFIYGNDDMFPLSPLKENDFFIEGKPCIHIYETQFPPIPNIFQKKCMRQQNMVGSHFGKKYSKTLFRNGHSLAPLLKGVCMEVHRRFGAEILSGITPDRTETSYNQYIYTLWQYFTSEYVDHTPEHYYAGVKIGAQRTIEIIKKHDCGIVCVNDHETMEDISEFASLTRGAIEEKLKMCE